MSAGVLRLAVDLEAPEGSTWGIAVQVCTTFDAI